MSTVTTKNYGKITKEEGLVKLTDKLIAQQKVIGFDIETGYDGIDREKLSLQSFHPDFKVVGYSFTNSTEWARYVPVAHDNGENIDQKVAAKALWKMLQTGLGIAHNAAFELNGLSRWFLEQLSDDEEVGEAVRASLGYFPIYSDTMLEAYMTGLYERIGLKDLTLQVFGHQMVKFMDLFPVEESELGPGTKVAQRKYVRFNTRNLVPEVINYACEDSVWCLALHEKHYDTVKNQLMFKTEMRDLPVLCSMEREGMLLDWNAFKREETLVQEFTDLLNEEIQKDLSDTLGEVININLGSVKQVQEVLYDKLGLPIKMRSETTGAPSTSEKALRSLVKENPIIKKILEYRELKKLKSSYITKYIHELSYAADGRAHPNHKQDGARTGRLAVDHVSYQQWPKPYHFELKSGKTYDLNYRDFLISPEDFRIVGYDYANVELRVLAAVAGEKVMLEAFANGEDVHKATASKMLGIPLDQVTSKERAVGKTLNFAIVYGSGANNIAEMLGITKEKAQEYLDQYFATFSGLKAWMDAQVELGKKNHFVTTVFGRIFTVWEYINSTETWIQAKGDRMCVNAPIQGGAADYMKIAMVRATKAIEAAEKDGTIGKGTVRLFMTVHDALEFYVHKSVDTQTVIDILSPAVSYDVAAIPVEIKADWHEGYKWGSVVEINLTDGVIDNWERTVETPAKEKFKFEGNSLDEVVEKVAEWEKNYTPPVKEEKIAEPTPVADATPLLVAEATGLVVTFAEMPDDETWSAFIGFLIDHSGPNSVQIITPEGSFELEFGVLIDEHEAVEMREMLKAYL